MIIRKVVISSIHAPHTLNLKGRNCLVHCAGGSGRTGMVIAAVVKNLGVSINMQIAKAFSLNIE